MSDDLVKRLRDSCKDIVTGEELLPGAFAYVTREEAYEYANYIKKLKATLEEIEHVVKYNRPITAITSIKDIISRQLEKKDD